MRMQRLISDTPFNSASMLVNVVRKQPDCVGSSSSRAPSGMGGSGLARVVNPKSRLSSSTSRSAASCSCATASVAIKKPAESRRRRPIDGSSVNTARVAELCRRFAVTEKLRHFCLPRPADRGRVPRATPCHSSSSAKACDYI